MGIDAKESASKRVTNETILDKIVELFDDVQKIKREIVELKVKTGSNDTPVSPPTKRNYNTDLGPFQQKKQPPVSEDEASQKFRSDLNLALQKT